MSAIALYHWAQRLHFSTQNFILSSKTSPWSILNGNFYCAIWAFFYAQIAPERLERDFDDFKSVFFQSQSML